ncbi:molybdopterin-binding protein [Steroidobacter flavus]|uniref:Molybdopterin-binding protein n=1 Tax=Steroidobacter flavus TaxID=1842136 RepID=A0ABV8T3M5_9GAMM
MSNADSPRRRFLRQLVAVGGGILLGACDSASRSPRVTKVLETGERLNRNVQHALTSRTTMAQEFTEADLSPQFRSNGTDYPDSAEYRALATNGFVDWRLRVDGVVERPVQLTLDQLRAMRSRTQITRHDCVEGWSAIGKWTGTPLSEVLALVRPRADARYVMFYCADPMDDSGTKYYESIDMEDAMHPQTILAYALNDAALPIPNGAPLRLRVERQLGYKMAKYLMHIELVTSFARINGGKGGYWEDDGYEWYAGI